MPIREIPKSYSNLTGKLASKRVNRMVSFESSLERDFFSILEFDCNVSSYEEQPVQISWTDRLGKARTYTPDCLVIYKRAHGAIKKEVVLYEVKYREDIFLNWPEYKLRFKAAVRFAKKRGWKFKLITEVEIREGSYLKNIKFLLPYTSVQKVTHAQSSLESQILKRLSLLGQSTPKELLSSLFEDPRNYAEGIFVLWTLVANKRVDADLTRPLSMVCEIWNSTQEELEYV